MSFLVVVLIGGVVIFAAIIAHIIYKVNHSTLKQLEQEAYGNLNPKMICTHCSEKGNVRTKPAVQKKGISGGKATAAVLTGGVSLLATGLARKENNTQARCGNCKNTWIF